MTATVSPQPSVLAEQRFGGPENPTRHRVSRRALGWQIGLYALLIVLALIYIYPFLVQVATSFKTDAAAAADPISLAPQPLSLAAYERLFLNSDFPVWFANSALVTVFVTVGRVFFASLAGYALARLDFRGPGVIFEVIVGSACALRSLLRPHLPV